MWHLFYWDIRNDVHWTIFFSSNNAVYWVILLYRECWLQTLDCRLKSEKPVTPSEKSRGIFPGLSLVQSTKILGENLTASVFRTLGNNQGIIGTKQVLNKKKKQLANGRKVPWLFCLCLTQPFPGVGSFLKMASLLPSVGSWFLGPGRAEQTSPMEFVCLF